MDRFEQVALALAVVAEDDVEAWPWREIERREVTKRSRRDAKDAQRVGHERII